MKYEPLAATSGGKNPPCKAGFLLPAIWTGTAIIQATEKVQALESGRDRRRAWIEERAGVTQVISTARAPQECLLHSFNCSCMGPLFAVLDFFHPRSARKIRPLHAVAPVLDACTAGLMVCPEWHSSGIVWAWSAELLPAPPQGKEGQSSRRSTALSVRRSISIALAAGIGRIPEHH